MTLEDVKRFATAGFAVIPLLPGDKRPDASLLPGGRWERYQTCRPTEADLEAWFGNCIPRNAGLVLGSASGDVLVVESDTPEAEAWCAANLPPTPMMTRSARGYHRMYL